MTIRLNPGDSINLTTGKVTNAQRENLTRNDLNALAFYIRQGS